MLAADSCTEQANAAECAARAKATFESQSLPSLLSWGVKARFDVRAILDVCHRKHLSMRGNSLEYSISFKM
ncbi:hypothetical protein thsrh120_58340 [Rhizobium sp. No.120]